MGREMCEIRQGHYYLVWFCVGFISGIFLWLVSPRLENIPFSAFLGYSLIFIIITAVIIFVPQKNLLSFADRVLILVILTGLMAGIFRTYYEDNFSHRALENTFGTEHAYVGYIISEPKPSSTGKTNGITVNVTMAKSKDNEIELSDKVHIYVDSALDINRGDIIEFTTTFSKPMSASFSGGFSYRNRLYKDKCRASGYVPDIKKSEDKIEKYGLAYHLQSLGSATQSRVLKTIEKYVGEYEQEYALLKGIVFGNKDDFSIEQYNKFAESGFIHITAASGMHVSFLCGFIFFLLKKIGLRRKIIYLLTLPVIFIFAAAAEFTPSINRAMIMTGVYILACLIQREPHSLTSLALAGVALLCINPYTITDYGFILSFGAVLGIIVFFGAMSGRIKGCFPAKYKGKKMADSLIDSTCLSLSGNLGLGYFLARFFNRFSWGGIIGNIIAIPLGAFSFIGGILVWALDFVFPAFAEILAKYLLRYALYILDKTADFFSSGFFNMYVPTPTYSFFPIYVMFCCAIYYCLSHKTLTLAEE